MKLLNRARVRTDFIRGLITGFGNVTSRFISLDASSATNPMIRFMSATNEEGRIDYTSAGPMTVNSEAALVLQSQDGNTKLSLGNTLLRSDFNTGITIGAGTATVPPVLLNGTTLMTTPADGAIEIDATNIYGTTDAGNRGYIPLVHYTRLNANRNLTSTVNEQAIFDSAADVLTLETGVYRFESILRVTSMSATSGNARIDFRGAGTATIDTWLWTYNAVDTSSPSPGPVTAQAGWPAQEDSAASIATAGAGTAVAVVAFGTFDVTGAGTVIPSIALVTAAVGVVTAGSYYRCERIGAVDAVSVGQWG